MKNLSISILTILFVGQAFAQSSPDIFVPPDLAPSYRECIETFEDTFEVAIRGLEEHIVDSNTLVEKAEQTNEEGIRIFKEDGITYTKEYKENLQDKIQKYAAEKNKNSAGEAEAAFGGAEAKGKEGQAIAERAMERFKSALEGKAELSAYLDGCHGYLTQRRTVLDNTEKDVKKIQLILVGLQALQTTLQLREKNLVISNIVDIKAQTLYNAATIIKAIGGFYGPVSEFSNLLSQDTEDSDKKENVESALKLIKIVDGIQAGAIALGYTGLLGQSKAYLACVASVVGAPGCTGMIGPFQASKVALAAQIAANIASTLNAVKNLHELEDRNNKHIDEIDEFLAAYAPQGISAGDLAGAGFGAGQGLGDAGGAAGVGAGVGEAGGVAAGLSDANQNGTFGATRTVRYTAGDNPTGNLFGTQTQNNNAAANSNYGNSGSTGSPTASNTPALAIFGITESRKRVEAMSFSVFGL